MKINIIKNNQHPLIVLIIFVCILFVYLPVKDFPFINYDDDEYVYNNSFVLKGLTLKGIIWAFSSFDAANWHPLTWISLMIDREIYKDDAGGFHLTNIFLHILNTILLFLILAKVTKKTLNCAFVAFLFGIHPIHVESVVWISERKDLLSALFMFLCISVYIEYVNKKSFSLYFRSFIYFLCGLMCKPMIITLPILLLFIDYWPLKRFDQKSKKIITNAFVEKIPFFALSLIVSFITIYAQKKSFAIINFPLNVKITNVFFAYCQYLYNIFYPFNLAFFYPFPKYLNISLFVFCIIIIVFISILAILLKSKIKWFFTGWFWYIISLIPVIGIIRAGSLWIADRYTYIPSIGIFIIFSWILSFWIKKRVFSYLIGFSCFFIIIFLSFLTIRQISYWQSSEKLFKRAIQVTKNNFIAHNNLGFVFFHNNKPDSALYNFFKAVNIFPDFSIANYNIGNIYLKQNQPQKALPFLKKAIESDSNYNKAYILTGDVYNYLSNDSLAIYYYQKSMLLDRNYFLPYLKIGTIFYNKNMLDSSILYLKQSIKRNPFSVDAHFLLGCCYLKYNIKDSANHYFFKAVNLDPVSYLLNLSIAKEYFNAGFLNYALYMITRAQRLSSKELETYHIRTNIFLLKNMPDSAFAECKKILKINSNDSLANLVLKKFNKNLMNKINLN